MNKIIIPVAAIAMGVALVGSVSSTLAWYQYSTKAQAAYIGTSVGQSENLEFKKADGTWGTTSLNADDIQALAAANGSGTSLIPITTDQMAKNNQINNFSSWYNSIETGTEGYADKHPTKANVVQFTLNVRYKKIAESESYLQKNLKLIDLTIIDADDEDFFKAIRVHFSAGSTHSLFARDKKTNDSSATEVITNTYGNLDTDNDGKLDTEMVYEWQDSSSLTPVMYGTENHQQVANNAAIENLNHQIGVIPANENGLAVTVTMWIEGWQKLSEVPEHNYAKGNGTDRDPEDAAIWDLATYAAKTFKVGMRFQAEDLD